MKETDAYLICSRSAACDAHMIAGNEPLFRCVSCGLLLDSEKDVQSEEVVFRSVNEAVAHLKKHRISAAELKSATNRIDFIAINSPKAFRRFKAVAGPFLDSILDSRK